MEGMLVVSQTPAAVQDELRRQSGSHVVVLLNDNLYKALLTPFLGPGVCLDICTRKGGAGNSLKGIPTPISWKLVVVN